MRILKKIWSVKWVLRSLPQTVYFNFHFLPFRQAIKLPIWLYKPRFGSLNGKLEIPAESVSPGLIRMGYFDAGIYSNNGIYLDIKGSVEFKGRSLIGNDCYICVEKNARVVFGDNFRATTTFRLCSCFEIQFGENVRLGWDCLVSDSDFHKLKRLDGTTTKGYGPIHIGSYNWIANGCRILKNSFTPDYCTIASGTIITSNITAPSYSVIGNQPKPYVIASGLWLDPEDDEPDYII